MTPEPIIISKPERELMARAFRLALSEVHPFAVQKARAALVKVFNYPQMHLRGNGLPYFSEIWREESRPDYQFAISGVGLLSSPLSLIDDTAVKESIKNLGIVLSGIKGFNQRFNEDRFFSSEYEGQKLIEQALLRYFYRFGVDEVLDGSKAWLVIREFLFAMSTDRLPLALVVPILMHKFEIDHYRLNDDAYIIKMSKPFQLARCVASNSTGGVSRNVIASATHAFVGTRWSIGNQSSSSVAMTLTDPSEQAFEEVDAFFAAFRIATNAVAGYGQVLQVPRGWGYSYKWDLPAMYVSEHRRYPMFYDRSYWQDDAARFVPKELMESVRNTYAQVMDTKHNKMQLALRRLNACVTRDDDVDAILDAIIGIELLLGDGNDSLTFKLRMRVAGLSKLTNGRFRSDQAYKEMRDLYETRSAIVHGSSKGKRSKNAEADSKTIYAAHRDLATRYLRMVIKTLLEHPQYLDPSKIDTELLINFGMEAEQPAQQDIPGLEVKD